MSSKRISEQIQDFLDNLKQLCDIESPDPSFVWPADYIDSGDYHGYVMDYVDKKNFHNLAYYDSNTCDIKLLTEISISIAETFNNLHKKKMYFCDINREDIFVNIDGGHVDVKILDCDNIPVTDNYSPMIRGKRGLEAPELITKKASQSIWTDLYSLAVVFFRLFVRLWPLEGKMTENILSAEDNERFFGREPLFIFDREDRRNRPGKGVSDLRMKMGYWESLPSYVKDLFYSVFEEGLFSADERPTLNEWIDALGNFERDEACGGIREPCDKWRLNVLVIVDTSGSMCGKRIDLVNECLKTICDDVRVSVPIDIDPYVNVMSFDDVCRWIFPRPMRMDEINDVQEIHLEAKPDSNTMMDDALKLLHLSIGKRYHDQSGAGSFLGHHLVSPIVIMISDGEPTTSIVEGMSRLKGLDSFKVALRLAFYIDEDCKKETLIEFTGDDRTVCDGCDLDMFRELIRRFTVFSSQITSTIQALPVKSEKGRGWAHHPGGGWTTTQERVAEEIRGLEPSLPDRW